MVRVAVYKNGSFQTVAGETVPSTHGKFRGAHDTGVPTGTVLSAPEIAITVSTPGAIIEDRHFYGQIVVTAPDVTIRRCKIEFRLGGNYAIDASAVPVSVLGNTYSLEIQDCDIDAGDLGASAGIFIGNYTAVRRCNVIGGDDGLKMNGTDALLEDSWVHEQTQYPGGHDDAMQTAGGASMIVRRNRLEVMNVEHDTMYNSCIQLGNFTSDLDGLDVSDNYFNGGNIQINGTGSNENGHLITGIVFRRNRFGPDYRTGQSRNEVVLGTGMNWDDSNVDDVTGQPVA